MKRIVCVILGASAGGLLSYFLAAGIFCRIGMSEGDCNLLSLCIAGPLGALAGSMAGWRFGGPVRPHKAAPGPPPE